jgi:hypothetical protein
LPTRVLANLKELVENLDDANAEPIADFVGMAREPRERIFMALPEENLQALRARLSAGPAAL